MSELEIDALAVTAGIQTSSPSYAVMISRGRKCIVAIRPHPAAGPMTEVGVTPTPFPMTAYLRAGKPAGAGATRVLWQAVCETR
jgi:hypothetical protein